MGAAKKSPQASNGGRDRAPVPGCAHGPSARSVPQKTSHMDTLRLGSTHNSTTPLKTTHQEKTYTMYHTYNEEIAGNGRSIQRAHLVVAVLLLVAVVGTTTCAFFFASVKHRVLDSVARLDEEMAAAKNITMMLDLAETAAQWSFALDTRPFSEASVITPEIAFTVQAGFVTGANLILSALEVLRTTDFAAAATSRCIDPNYTSQGRKQPCPLKRLLAQLEAVDAKFKDALTAAVLRDRLRIADIVNEVVVNRLPSSWKEVSGPMSFVFSTASRHQEIKDAVDSYLDTLQRLTAELAAQRDWASLMWAAGAVAAILATALISFIVAVTVFSRRLQRAFEVCQEAFFESVEELRKKIDEMTDFVHASFEYCVAPNLHVVSGVAALAGVSSALTPYHQKILKIMEKCVVDTEAATVNAVSCLASEVEVHQAAFEETNIREVVEDCLKIFSAKTEARGLPVSCTFGSGCPSLALVDSQKLRTILTKILSFVVDHTLEKGRGIDVFVNASAAAARPGDSLAEFRSFTIHFEVKGHGVCMENREAQELGQPKSLLKRSGHGLRMLCTAKLLQTMGGSMQILSSPSRGTFVSFQIRTRARFRLLDFQKGFRASLAGAQRRILALALSLETSRCVQFLCNDVGLQFVSCFCLKHLQELLASETNVATLAFLLGDFVELSADPAHPASRRLSAAEIFHFAREAAEARTRAAERPPVLNVFISSSGDPSGSEGSEGDTLAQPLPEDVIRLSVPVRTEALIRVFAKATESLTGGTASAEDEDDAEEAGERASCVPGEPFPSRPQLGSVRKEFSGSASPRTSARFRDSMEPLEGTRRQRRSPEPAGEKKKRQSTFRISVSRRQTLGARARSTAREASMISEKHRARRLFHTVFRGKDAASRRGSSDSGDKPASLSEDSQEEDDSEEEAVEVFPLHNEALQSLFPAGRLIPDPLVASVNAVVQAINQTGISRPAGELAEAIAAASFQGDLEACAKFVDAFDGSLALLRYYQALPLFSETRASQRKKRETGSFLADPDPHGVDRTWRPQARRRDPLVAMKAVSSLHIKVPQEPEVQAFFNLASSSLSFDDEPLNIHQVLNWDFHVLNLTPSSATRVTRDLLHHFALSAQLEVPGEILMGFAVALYKNYEPNPYHNFFHALNVAQILCLLMSLPDVAAQFQPIDFFVLSVAALGHDLGHPGVNNVFINRNNCLPARLYQNLSVLENYHAALLFQVLRHPRFNVFCSIPPQTFSTYRKRIISAILWTDMAKHFGMVAKLQEKIAGEMVQAEGIIVTLQKPYLEGLLLHASDISNPMLAFEFSYAWALRACDEFIQQNKLEQQLGQPPHMPTFADFNLYNVAKCQVNFIDCICSPLFGSLAQMFPAQLGDRAAELKQNRYVTA
ncbi:3'5'-cyclic nucleotide phosphodiesterase domain-containing protein [Besnoitia besnoiti]|uniref:Phosphodiesterase n=1 Tax=Besnoitia besnoiti TaxID=94643 RepID=A0A2A9MMG0_BESBE|nr:3'5'-cyclic nucleotide phosphodiesterase domain-containing protein [Besnoitia besnoiti]PFH38524.1 3'5'-cyclic nucleotide phosphodiesterase domain-containing protein [Besnoitia besnoiti]